MEKASDETPTESGTWSQAQALGANSLKAAFNEALDEAEFLDMKMSLSCQDSWNRCQNLLCQMEFCSQALSVKVADRSFRQQLGLLVGDGRNYLVHMYLASMPESMTVVMNGQEFKFSSEVALKAEMLRRSMASMCKRLSDWEGTEAEAAKASLARKLSHFDRSWARFEQAYLTELLRIESASRGPLNHLLSADRCLRDQLAWGASPSAMRQERRIFCDALADLNRLANTRHRSCRSDFDVRVWELACEMQSGSHPCEGLGPLASEFLETMEALRQYLQAAPSWLRFAPAELADNNDVVEHLQAIEEKWELASDFLMPSRIQEAVSFMSAHLRRLRSEMPELEQLMEERHPDLFLALPRLLWLFIFAEPHRCWAVVDLLIPKERVTDAAGQVCAELKNLQNSFLQQRFLELQEGWRGEPLVAQAVGFGRGATEAADFFLRLERWSMELHRQRPEEWNRLSSVLLQCSGTTQASPAASLPRGRQDQELDQK